MRSAKLTPMRCPRCQGRTRVVETRRADRGGALRRRRECGSCASRFTTFERYERGPLRVRKRSGRREPFDRVKLRAGLLRAAHKRPVRADDIEALDDAIEEEIERAGGELPAERVGEMCLEGLRRIDRVSYLQFAAVYKELTDIDEVQAELAQLRAESPGPARRPRRTPVIAGSRARRSVRVGDDPAGLPPEAG